MAMAAPDTILLATSIATFIAGYLLGVYATQGYVFVSPELADERKHNLHDPVESDESDVDEGDTLLDHAPNWANGFEADSRDGLRARKDGGEEEKKKKNKKKGGKTAELVDASAGDSDEECKLVLVVRTDLGMTKGKIAAQCSHATLACYKTLSSLSLSSPSSPSSSPASKKILQRWERHGQAKIAVQTRSEEELLRLLGEARGLGITAEVVQDAGRTQIEPGSVTVLGVGPAPRSLVDRVTGGLKLL